MLTKHDEVDGSASSTRNESIRLALAALLPFLAWGLQSLLWDVVQPFVWFFFYPAALASSWISGRTGGLIATAISVLLVNYFFMEPVHTLRIADLNQFLTVLMFGAMGIVFALVQGAVKTALARRQTADARLRTMFEDSPLGVALIDSQTGHIYEVNRRFAAIAGRTPEEMLSIDWMSITHPDDVQEDQNNMARLNAGEIPGFQMNKRYLKPDGAVVWIRMTIAPVSVAPGEYPRHLCMIEDITERRATDQRLALVLERFKLANDVADIGIWDQDLQNNRLEWDDRLCDWYGLTPEEEQAGLLYDRWRVSVHPDDVALVEHELQEALKTGHFDTTFRIRRPDGVIRVIRSAANVTYDTNHQPLRMLGINQDITAQQAQLTALAQAHAQLERVVSEVQLSAIIKQGLVGIGEATADGHLVQVNDHLAGMLGYTVEELLGLTLRDITDPRDWRVTETHLHDQMQRGGSFTLEKRYRRKSGESFWGKVIAMPVVDPKTHTQTTLALILDIDAVKQSEERLRLALAGSRIGMYDWDILSGTITWTSEHEQLWGYQPGEFDGTFEGFARRVHPDDLKVTQEILEGARNSGEPYRHDFRVIWPDGSLHWISGRGEFEFDAAGQPLRMRGTVIDITHRIQAQAELREQQERLAEAQRIAKIGGWVHDLNGRIDSWSAEMYPELFKIVVASTRNFVFFKQPFRTALDSGRPRSGWSSF